ncbi:MAG: DUF819 family protein [Candidatus Sumerlaeales bacterium]|nr:DUF819 family protein [Candidatus Sumerlaeales bacterium]
MTALITDPYQVFVFLLTITGVVFGLSEVPQLKKFFHYVSPILFCYFLPMVATTCGILPAESPVYGLVNKAFLPTVLILVMLSCDVRSILKLGPKALGIMACGSIGVMAGCVIAYFCLGGKETFGEWGWACLGALSASWVGGSANMIAVTGSLGIPDIAPVLLVDSVFVYTWMGMLIVLATWQHSIDKKLKIDPELLTSITKRVSDFADQVPRPISTSGLLLMLALGFGSGAICTYAGNWLYDLIIKPFAETYPTIKSLSAFTLTIMLVTVLGVLLSMTPVRKLEAQGASSVGYALLYLLLPTFGAQADLRVLSDVHWYFVAGLIIILSHGLFIVIGMRLFRIPLFLGATASQANLGGPASAPVVAAAYQPSLMPVGLLLGVLGGIIGTYTGLIVAALCKAVD